MGQKAIAQVPLNPTLSVGMSVCHERTTVEEIAHRVPKVPFTIAFIIVNDASREILEGRQAEPVVKLHSREW